MPSIRRTKKHLKRLLREAEADQFRTDNMECFLALEDIRNTIKASIQHLKIKKQPI